MDAHITVHLDLSTLCEMLTQGLNEYWFRKEDLFTCVSM